MKKAFILGCVPALTLLFCRKATTSHSAECTIGSDKGIRIQGGVLYLVFCPRTRSKTFLQCFALEQRESKAKHCRNVLGCVLGRKN